MSASRASLLSINGAVWESEKNMNGLNQQDAVREIAAGMDRKLFSALDAQPERTIESFLLYDLHFMRLTGVLDEDGNSGDIEYDDEDAFEYIFDAYLSDHPSADKHPTEVATLIDEYIRLFYDYLHSHGLTQA